MGKAIMLHLIFGVLFVLGVSLVNAEDPYLYYTWTVCYGTRSILGVPQQVILINDQFPGPKLEVVTNNNIILNLINKLDQPFLLTRNGIKQRKNSWQDGMLGTNCPIPPNNNEKVLRQANYNTRLLVWSSTTLSVIWALIFDLRHTFLSYDLSNFLFIHLSCFVAFIFSSST